MSQWAAAEIGSYDQLLASADAEIDRLVTTLKVGTGNVGEHQAIANVGLALSWLQPAELTGLLVAALRRLATESGRDEAP